MSVWGVGFGFRFGAGPVAIGAVSGKYAFWFVWDDCGDSGVVFMLEPGIDVGLQIQTPIVVELNGEAMVGHELTSLGGGCVKDLEGWAGGIDAGIKLLGDAEMGIDVTSHGMVLITAGVGLETGAGVSGGAHVTRKWFIPVRVGNCPCQRSILGGLLNVFAPAVSGTVALGRALWNLAGSAPPEEQGQ